jgi:type 1 glutamine amidotransferase
MSTCTLRVAALGLLGLLAAAPLACSAADEAFPSRRVLLVTGEDYAGHLWQETAPALAASLAADPRLSVEVHDDLTTLATHDLSPYAAVVLHFKNYDPAVPGRQAFERLVRFSEAGGGLVLSHFACGAFEEYADEFEQLVGRVWMGEEPPPGRFQHDPHGEFEVRVLDSDHPATTGLASFTTTDELYTCLVGEPEIEVLAEATSIRDGRTYPLAFVLQGSERRVFHCVLGHDVAALSVPSVAELYRRGTAWAAGLPPVAAPAPVSNR